MKPHERVLLLRKMGGSCGRVRKKAQQHCYISSHVTCHMNRERTRRIYSLLTLQPLLQDYLHICVSWCTFQSLLGHQGEALWCITTFHKTWLFSNTVRIWDLGSFLSHLTCYLSVCLSINCVGVRRAMNYSFWLLIKTVLKRCVVTVQTAVGTWEVEAYEWENVFTVT